MAEDGYQGIRVNRAACRQFDLELSAFLEGEDRPALSAHARECAYCRGVLSDLEQIRSAAREMAQEEPSARVWANIRAALADEGLSREPTSQWRRWFDQIGFLPSPAPAGALAGLVMFSLLLLTTSGNFEQRPTGLTTSLGPEDISTERALVTSQDVALAARTVREMESSYMERVSSLDPDLKSIYERSLESLNGSIRECLDSIRREPANRLAREYLVAAYTEKAEVLAAALELDGR